MMNKWTILILSLALAGAAVGCGEDKNHGNNNGTDGGADDDGGLSTSELITAAEGGEISLDNATLNIPAGALDEDTTITVEQLSSDGLPGEEDVIGDVYDFGPDGTTFNVPVTLTLNGSNIPDNAVIAFLNSSNKWETLTDSEVGSGAVTATTTHFTKFAIVIVSGQQTAGSCEGTFDACGGDLAGTSWQLVDSEGDCATVPSIASLIGQFQCTDKTVAINASFEGSVAFGNNNDYNLDVLFNVGFEITLGKDCLGGECGDDFTENQDGKCVSTEGGDDESNPESGTYAVGDNNTLTFTKEGGNSDNEENQIIDYCITGTGQNAKLAVRVRQYSDANKTTLETEARFHAVPSQL